MPPFWTPQFEDELTLRAADARGRRLKRCDVPDGDGEWACVRFGTIRWPVPWQESRFHSSLWTLTPALGAQCVLACL